ncbi:hypothetical protein KJ940_10605 [Myxococcota bacterium]|nr:hypothetical protein [Myxococcota bacterium]
MSRTYFCPHCKAILNPNIKVVLAVQAHGQRGLILLSAQPGDYEVIVAPAFQLNEGDDVDFFCPVCQASLRCPQDSHLAELGFRSINGEGRVEFSRVYGEHATYFVTKEEISSFGESADLYGHVNFFGV